MRLIRRSRAQAQAEFDRAKTNAGNLVGLASEIPRHEWEDDEHYAWRCQFVRFLRDGPPITSREFGDSLRVFRDWHEALRRFP